MIRNISITLMVVSLLSIGSDDVKAQSINPDSAAFYVNLGKAERAAGRNNPAWNYFDKAAKYDPGNADIQLSIAEVCLKMPRKQSTAIRALEMACRLKPIDYLIQWKLIGLYFKFDQYDSIINLLPHLRSHYQETPDWAWMLGKSYYYSIAQQNYGQAIKYLEISLKDDPANGEAAYLVGRMYAKMENFGLAAAYYKRMLAIDSTSQPGRFYEYAVVLFSANQFEASIDAFNKALELNYKPRDDFFEYMAEACVGAGKTKIGIDITKGLLIRRPQDIGLWNELAAIYYSTHQYGEAKAGWAKVAGIANGSDSITYAHALYQMGSAEEKMGNDKEGDALHERAIKIDPSLQNLKTVHQGLF